MTSSVHPILSGARRDGSGGLFRFEGRGICPAPCSYIGVIAALPLPGGQRSGWETKQLPWRPPFCV
ncbi:hypothetical protein [Azospirillum melinis]